jgi:aryl-alcohol dehydrogenase-like predicted oxidoreductase
MSTVPKRKLGSHGAECCAISYGAMGIGGGITYYTDEMREKAEETMDKYLKAGGDHIDTSDLYGPFKGEVILGEMIAKHGRDKFFIATKMAACFWASEDERFKTWGCPCAHPDYIKQCCEASLKRLGVECIDLYYLHRADPKTPVEESMQAMKELIAEGKIKYVGLSEHTPELIRRAHAVCPITAVQQEWSLFARDLEEDIVPVCRELGIGIVPYSPVGRGMLTGAYKSRDDVPSDWRKGPPDGMAGTCGRFLPENFDHNIALVKKLEALADKKGCKASQLAIAWLLSQGDDIVPIPATTNPVHLEENMGAWAVKEKLTPEDIAEIVSTVPVSEVKGARYTMPHMTYNGK